MTNKQLIKRLMAFPDDSEVIIKVGEDSRDNPVYHFIVGAEQKETGDLGSEMLDLYFDDEQPIIILEAEE